MNIGYQDQDFGMGRYYNQINQQQLNERSAWEQSIIDSDMAELQSLAEEEYEKFAFVNDEEYYRKWGFDGAEDSDWQNWLLDEKIELIRHRILSVSAQRRAIDDMREAMECAIEQGKEWTTLAWIAEKIEADDQRRAEYAAAFDRMMSR